jgi:hypothetical protein
MLVFSYMLFLHFLADFAFQWRDMAKKKTEDHVVLSHHCMIVYAVFTAGLMPVIGAQGALLFGLLNGLSHALIDWNVWKWYKYSVAWRNRDTSPEVLKDTWEYWKDYWFYFNIGLDQLLHGITLAVCYHIAVTSFPPL